MKIPRTLNHRHTIGPAMTPMIDVVFLLLIFFLSTTSFQSIEGTLPSKLLATEGNSVAAPQDIPEIELERIVIKVTGNGEQPQFSVNNQGQQSLGGLAELLEKLGKIDDSLPVILDIDAQIPLGTAVDVYDACRLASFLKVQFAVPEELLK